MTDNQPCPMCAGTGKVEVKDISVEPFSVATHFVLDSEVLKNLKVICGT